MMAGSTGAPLNLVRPEMIDRVGDSIPALASNMQVINDAEAAHVAAATGIHGVGASTVESIAGAQAKVDSHAGLTAPHSAVAAPTADRLILRDAAGRAQVAAPAVNADIARLDTINFVIPMRTADRWYCAGMNNATALVTGAPTANVLRAMPLIISRVTTLDRLGINITATVAGNCRLGIYDNTLASCYPASLLVGSADISTGAAGLREAVISLALNPGLYWLVLVSNAAPTIRALAVDSCMAVLGLDAALGTAPGVGWSVAFTYAFLPATFPTGAAAITAIPIPAIFARASA